MSTRYGLSSDNGLREIFLSNGLIDNGLIDENISPTDAV